jgi:hypothetical protein
LNLESVFEPARYYLPADYAPFSAAEPHLVLFLVRPVIGSGLLL